MTDFRVDGVAEIRALGRELDMAIASTRDRAKDAVRKAAFATERGAKVRAPVDTGNLRNSINTSLFGTGATAVFGGGSSPIAAEVGPEANYAPHLEFGTWKMAPQPYLGPAFDEVEPSFLAALDDIAGQALG